MSRTLVSAVLFAALGAGAAGAEQAGDRLRGRVYAERVCAECHAIDRSRAASPMTKATPFPVVADTPGMTATALAVWLRTPHPTMPNLIVADGDLGDIIVYVLSLRTPR